MAHPADNTGTGVVGMSLASGMHMGAGYPILKLFSGSTASLFVHIDSGNANAQNLAVEFADDAAWVVYRDKWILFKKKRQQAIVQNWAGTEIGTGANPWGMGSDGASGTVEYVADGEGNLYAVGPSTNGASATQKTRKIRRLDISGTLSAVTTCTFNATPSTHPVNGSALSSLDHFDRPIPQNSGLLFPLKINYVTGNILALGVVTPSLSASVVPGDTSLAYESAGGFDVAIPQPAGLIIAAQPSAAAKRLVNMNADGTYATDVLYSSLTPPGGMAFGWLTTTNHWIEQSSAPFMVDLDSLTDVTPAWMDDLTADTSAGYYLCLCSPNGNRFGYIATRSGVGNDTWEVYNDDGDLIMKGTDTGNLSPTSPGRSPSWPVDQFSEDGMLGNWQHAGNNCVACSSPSAFPTTLGWSKLSLDSLLTSHQLTEGMTPYGGAMLNRESRKSAVFIRGQFSSLTYADWF